MAYKITKNKLKNGDTIKTNIVLNNYLDGEGFTLADFNKYLGINFNGGSNEYTVEGLPEPKNVVDLYEGIEQYIEYKKTCFFVVTIDCNTLKKIALPGYFLFYLILYFSLMLSAIIAMNSLFVGFPLVFCIVYPKYEFSVSTSPLSHATSIAWRIARSTRDVVV